MSARSLRFKCDDVAWRRPDARCCPLASSACPTTWSSTRCTCWRWTRCRRCSTTWPSSYRTRRPSPTSSAGCGPPTTTATAAARRSPPPRPRPPSSSRARRMRWGQHTSTFSVRNKDKMFSRQFLCTHVSQRWNVFMTASLWRIVKNNDAPNMVL